MGLPRLSLVRVLLVLGAILAPQAPSQASEPANEPSQDSTSDIRPADGETSIESLAAAAQPGVVVISVAGRPGRAVGLGTGFVVAADGLVATNFHVIGETRPIEVRTSDGQIHAVTEIFASDRALDLAVIRIRANGLHPLPLGTASSLAVGQSVVAIGNPHGLEHSVVAGVVSGTREVDGRPMVQLAIPIEPGNSGGPVLDREGRVIGIMTMKSAVTANLGFAVGIDLLQPLLQRPNPVPIQRWLAINALDTRRWNTLFGANWRQRGGSVTVEGAGDGFGGRALCLSTSPPPHAPYELSVSVRMDDESGAAGLAFASNGGDRHFGFYPSAGNLRLTHFQGPDVSSWQVLRQEPSPHYRPGQWNTLRVRVEDARLLCYVNDGLVFEQPGLATDPGRVGLAKFRDTRAEFKGFRMLAGSEMADERLPWSTELAQSVAEISLSGPLPEDLLTRMSSDTQANALRLRDRANHLARQAVRLDEMARALHHRRVLGLLEAEVTRPEHEIDLWQAALLIAFLDNEALDLSAYQDELGRMASELARGIGPEAGDAARLAALKSYVFADNGFHGSRTDYYNRANSYVSDLLDDREGLPITLSVLYMELGRRVGLNIAGIGLPGHFVVRHLPKTGEGDILDVFNAAEVLSPDQARARAVELGLAPEDALWPMSKPDIVVRMLNNLLADGRQARELPRCLRYLDAILVTAPDSSSHRWERAVYRYQSQDRQGAAADCEWLLANPTADIELDRVRELHSLVQ